MTALWVYGSWKTDRSEEEYPPVGQFVTVDGVRLHCVHRGGGQPVVMIHGSDGVLQDFTLTIFDSVATFAHAIAFDRPGHGYSERPDGKPLTLELNARLIHDAVAALGILKPVIVGHSYGGAVALQYAAMFPQELAGLVLLSPAVYAESLPIGKTGATFVMSIPNAPVLGSLLTHCLVAPLLGFGVVAGIRPTFEPNPVNPEYATIMKGMMPRPGQFRAWADESAHFASGLNELESRLSGVTTRTIIIVGEKDRVAPYEQEGGRLAKILPNCELVVVPDGGHMVHYAAPGVVASKIREMVNAATVPDTNQNQLNR
jgi:pimeloyl-ACP methyl ester carboxylesterase